MRSVVVIILLALTAWVAVATIGGAGAAAPWLTAPVPPHAPEARALAGSAAHGAHSRPRRKIPRPEALREAWRWARDRAGTISFGVVDTEGELRGRDENRRYAAASVVKAMLLAAEVRRLKHAGHGIDPETDALLRAMITRSDNDAADVIYGRVGDAGLFRVAKRAGMTRFVVAGHWGNAQITAADMARFFGDLDRMFPRRHREYAKGLLGSVISSQSWGIPRAAGDDWAVRFKGGWLPSHALVHQAAELRRRGRDRKLAMAILTDSQPSHTYGTESVRGIAERLLDR